MPSQLFQTKQVTYGMAPFRDARVGFNSAAGCLNLLVKGARCGAIELVTGFHGPAPPSVVLESEKCRIGTIVEVDFEDSAQAQRFASCLQGRSPMPKPAMSRDEIVSPAPGTPPAKPYADMETPQKVKRLRMEVVKAALTGDVEKGTCKAV
uniref:Uncharacterized protein n=1 Tax=Strombidinopsis acuminata TaxID=141414 RepID=A0A7S3T824_9SPIT